jgi:hypothetical protein
METQAWMRSAMMQHRKGLDARGESAGGGRVRKEKGRRVPEAEDALFGEAARLEEHGVGSRDTGSSPAHALLRGSGSKRSSGTRCLASGLKRPTTTT